MIIYVVGTFSVVCSDNQISTLEIIVQNSKGEFCLPYS